MNRAAMAYRTINRLMDAQRQLSELRNNLAMAADDASRLECESVKSIEKLEAKLKSESGMGNLNLELMTAIGQLSSHLGDDVDRA